MGDVLWTLNLCMKDAPRGKNFVQRQMERDLICYFNIFGLIEEYGYTEMDNLYCKRYGHGNRRTEMVEITCDAVVNRMLHEHAVHQKLSLFVAKHTGSTNAKVQCVKQVHSGSKDAALEWNEALSAGEFNGSENDMGSSHETEHEGERVELESEFGAMNTHKTHRSVHLKMHKKLRRLQNLRFGLEDEESEDEDDENLQDPLELVENEEEVNVDLQDSSYFLNNEEKSEMDVHDTTELDATLPPEPKGSIKIIWPNGVTKEFRGCFQVSTLMNKISGKVIVETDHNGIPNQRSAGLLGSLLGVLAKKTSYAPLHIPRWDNKLLRTPKEQLIIYVETKFMYPEETKYNTRDWILRVVNKRWRDYKSFLKNKYYNPNERSLEQIKRDVPPGVNKYQWASLIGIWCQEQHTKMCQRNSKSAKQQRHPHTTGRKSHARLKKEMEDKNKGHVHKIDLWDEAHKKRDGKYVNGDVEQLMHKAHNELAARKRKKKGNLSSKDIDRVFDDVISKESTTGGYYDERYWGKARLYQGSTLVGQSASEVIVQKELQAVKTDKKFFNEVAERMCAFMAVNCPNQELMNERMVAQNEGKGSDKDGDGVTHYEVDNVCESMENVHTSENDPKEFKKTESQEYQTTQKKRKIVVLLSMNTRKKALVVAKGIVESKDKEYMVGGDKLGDAFYGITIEDVSKLGSERLPRPYGDIQIVEDAIGYCIAWPRTHVKRIKDKSN